ncbi:phosphatase PAP2 family protein [Klenkia brasiliensis]|uniref:Undecaprenyl-diphosphatase n=1 Tax=Klenkia brasiliensis TaxID=333142 RepID=A0A1G7URE6_9ACTN|nr:phosphatase PAP2 family protein [Klenkia brasiliensis]SDG49801.1 undecaprenyl-diphosphatase [Klenkia brasiliensis]
MTTLRRLDDQLLFEVNHIARSTPGLHGVVLGYATYGVVLFAVLLILGLLATRSGSDRQLAAAGWAAGAPLIAVGLNQPLVGLVAEARPYTSHPGVLVLATRSSDYSFPSDHAVMAGAAAAGLWLASRRLGWVALGAALLMAFARVYIAAHYPWDVAAGLLVGAVVTVVGWALLRRLLTTLTQRLRRQPGLSRLFPDPAAGRAGTPAGAATA